jgi:hypothetical protein
MTIWARKGGTPGGGFLAGALLGVLGVFILAAARPGPKEIDRAARSAGLVRCPTARNSSATRRRCAGTASVRSRLPPRPAPCDRRPGQRAPNRDRRRAVLRPRLAAPFVISPDGCAQIRPIWRLFGRRTRPHK